MRVSENLERRKRADEAAAAIRRAHDMPDELVLVAAAGELWAARAEVFQPRPTATSWRFEEFEKLLDDTAGSRWIHRSDLGEIALFVAARERLRAVARGERP